MHIDAYRDPLVPEYIFSLGNKIAPPMVKHDGIKGVNVAVFGLILIFWR